MTDLFTQGYSDCLDGLDPQSMDCEYLHGYDCELQSQEYFEDLYDRELQSQEFLKDLYDL